MCLNVQPRREGRRWMSRRAVLVEVFTSKTMQASLEGAGRVIDHDPGTCSGTMKANCRL